MVGSSRRNVSSTLWLGAALVTSTIGDGATIRTVSDTGPTASVKSTTMVPPAGSSIWPRRAVVNPGCETEMV